MWKILFEFLYLISYLIKDPKKREHFRVYTLYDYKNKLNALLEIYKKKNIKITKLKMIKGGWNIGFIFNNHHVYKIRKHIETDNIARILHEKRITDAFAGIVPLKIPKIDIIKTEKYTFYRYNFIPGHNLNTFSLRTILKHRNIWAKQIAEFIFALHNAKPQGLDDLKSNNSGDGWCHNDICNNIIVDTKTMKIIGLIDWEYSGWNTLEHEFHTTAAYSSKLRKAEFEKLIRQQYNKI